MITKAIIQFVYLNSNNLSSDFRHCGTSNSLIFSSTSYESYSDADKGARDEGFEVLTTQHSSRLWNNFEQPLTTEAGDGVEIVKTISWMSSRISKPSQQIENPFWGYTLLSL